MSDQTTEANAAEQAVKASPYPPKDKPTLLRRLVGLGIAGGIGYFVIFGIPGTGPTTCTTLVSDVVKISAENSNGFGAKVIDLVETKEVSKTDKELKCSAIGILSSGMKQTIVYRSYEEYGKWWVQFEPEGLPFS